MKIMLAVPVRPKHLDFWVMPPLGIGYVARALEREGHEVEILNCPKEKFSLSDFEHHFVVRKPDMLGITMFSHDLQYTSKMLDVAKVQNNKVITIVGGPHPSSMPNETLELFPSLDFAVCGEGEVSISMLVEALSTGRGSLNSIPNLVWRDESGGVIINERRYIENLDFLEMPAWNLIGIDSYPKTPPTLLFKKQPFAPISVTRGCPFSCTFCSAHIHGRKIRYRSVENVLAEIDLLYKHYGIKEFYIVDDNFTANKAMVKRFCNEIINRKYDIAFCNPNGVRLDTLDMEMLTLMKKAGWYYLSVGIESGSQPVLDHMRKRINIPFVREKVSLIRKAGLEVYGFFIVGYPTETIEDIKKTVNLALELDLIGANFSCFHPLPGTAIFEMLVQNGKIKREKFTELFNSTYADVAYSPDNISVKTLKSIQRKAILRFYFRPKVIFKNLMYLKSAAHLRFLIARASAYILGS